MNKNLKPFLILAIQSILFWVIAFTLFLLFRYYGFGEDEGIIEKAELKVPISQWIDLGVYLGIIVGIFYAIIEALFDKFISTRISLGLAVLLKNATYLILLIISLTFISILAENRMDIDLNNDIGWWHTDKTFRMVVLFFAIASLVFSFIKIANNKFGRGVFLNMLLGKYRKPQEERRVLMFLDLKDSTTIAENLGHIIYSQYIQDCFLDLNSVLNKYEAEVYQYVGDEAVLSWTYKKGIYNNNCINLFFAFQNRLLQRSSYYRQKYNNVPVFKAGIHGGKLMIAEVGVEKKELAYHGDVINTTARIQGECNKYKESLLISESLLAALKITETHTSRAIGNIILKGKQQAVNIVAINKV